MSHAAFGSLAPSSSLYSCPLSAHTTRNPFLYLPCFFTKNMVQFVQVQGWALIRGSVDQKTQEHLVGELPKQSQLYWDRQYVCLTCRGLGGWMFIRKGRDPALGGGKKLWPRREREQCKGLPREWSTQTSSSTCSGIKIWVHTECQHFCTGLFEDGSAPGWRNSSRVGMVLHLDCPVLRHFKIQLEKVLGHVV